MTWDPAQYLRFGDVRLRAGVELLGRIDHDDPHRIHDVGCGTGTLTRLLAERWPDAIVTGSDTSVEMLDRARDLDPEIGWELSDVSAWNPPHALDVVFSNAVLHWVPDHDDVILSLLETLNPGGVLALQMPLSWVEPSHTILREVIDQGGVGSPDLRRWYATRPVADAEHYYDLLRNEAANVDIWTTRYLQVLSGQDPVLEWMMGSWLRPLLDELDEAETGELISEYRRRLTGAYPPHPGGDTVFPFSRLFIVAMR